MSHEIIWDDIKADVRTTAFVILKGWQGMGVVREVGVVIHTCHGVFSVCKQVECAGTLVSRTLLAAALKQLATV